MGVSAGGAYLRRVYSYVLQAYFDKLTFLGGLSAGGLSAGGALSRIFMVCLVDNYAV